MEAVELTIRCGSTIDTSGYNVSHFTFTVSCNGTIPDNDFNDDGRYNCLDIDALVTEIAGGTNNASFDLTGDGLVNLADRDAWLAEAGGINLGPGKVYLLGDANLDGRVDGSDFGVWNAFKFTAVAALSSGDFNADGINDGSDFGTWNTYKFQSSDNSLRTLGFRVDPVPGTAVADDVEPPALRATSVDAMFASVSQVVERRSRALSHIAVLDGPHEEKRAGFFV